MGNMICFDNMRNQIGCPNDPSIFTWTNLGLLALAIVAIIAALMIILPIYNVWTSRKAGQAELAEAQFEQQIQIAEAQGRFNAAELNKKAAVVEAEAVSAQITIIGEHLKQHDLYLRWQWIEMMKHRQGETIYVPTEANLPILEATRNNK